MVFKFLYCYLNLIFYIFSFCKKRFIFNNVKRVLKYWFKVFSTSLSSVTVFPSATKNIYVLLKPLSGRRGLTVFQKSLLSVVLFKSRLLKYFFLSLLYSLLQKFLCRLKSFKFSVALILKYLFCSSVFFSNAFLIVFVTYGA